MGRGARELLIAAEVALSIVLLVGAGLMIRSLWQLQDVNPGFNADKVLTMEVSLPVARYEEGDADAVLSAARGSHPRALPASPRSARSNILPLSNNYDSRASRSTTIRCPMARGRRRRSRSITPGYFRAMGIPLVRGREFNAHDVADGQLVVIVSESMAREVLAGRNGRDRQARDSQQRHPRERQQVVGGPGSRVVVGVVGDVKHLALEEAEVPMIYEPHTQQPSYHTMRLVIRAEADAAALTGQVRDALNQMDREVPLSQVATLSTSLEQVRGRTADAGDAAGTVCGTGDGACRDRRLRRGGVPGRTAHAGDRRPPRARRAGRAMWWMLVRESMRPVTTGIGVGLLGAFALSRVLAAMLFQVSSTDVTTYAIACGVLAIAALLASVIPARRALGVDPITAVRGQ